MIFKHECSKTDIDPGDLLQRQHKEAVKDSAIQDAIFAEFTERLRDENVVAWIAAADAYAKDPSQPDPYYREVDGLTEADIRLQLAEEDDRAVDDGQLSLHEVTPAAMLIEMLDIEEQQ